VGIEKWFSRKILSKNSFGKLSAKDFLQNPNIEYLYFLN